MNNEYGFVKSISELVEDYANKHNIETGSSTKIIVELCHDDLMRFIQGTIDYLDTDEGREENKTGVSENDIAERYTIVIKESDEATPNSPILSHEID